MMAGIIVYPIAVPMLGAAVLAALSKVIGRRGSSTVALAIVTLVVADAIRLLHDAAHPIVYWSGGWAPRNGVAIGIALFADPIAAALVLVTALLVAASLVFSLHYFDTVGVLFHVLVLVFLAAMCGFALAGDLFTLVVFLELMGVCAYALCAYKTDEEQSLQGALNFAFTNTIGACILIFGVGLLYARTGALNLAQVGRALASSPPDALVKVAFAMVSCGLLVKGATVPFHFWLADAHAVAPTPISVLFSGIMVELGLYGVARVYWCVFRGALYAIEPPMRMIFIGGGVASIIIGAIMCLNQQHLKRLLAFSTISHMGVMLCAFGLFDVKALAGAAIYMLGHAAAKSSLFLCAGIVLHRLRGINAVKLQGRGKSIAWAGIILAIAAAALAGGPGTALAIGDHTIDDAASQLGYGWLRWVIALGGILTAAAVLSSGIRIFLGWGAPPDPQQSAESMKDEEPETDSGESRTAPFMWFPALALAICAFGLAFVPHISQSAEDAAGFLTNGGAYATAVLDGTPVTVPAAPVRHESGSVEPWIILAFAVGFGVFACTRAGIWVSSMIEGPPFLRRLHSGHVGDYVSWVAVGTAGFAVSMLIAQ
jgi:multicomponent Na+:H+ antiporter subunit D